jgi:hypothetical protein
MTSPVPSEPPTEEPQVPFEERLADFILNQGGAQGLAGLGLLTGAYSRLGSIGERGLGLGRNLARQQLQQAAFRPYTVTTATGGEFGMLQDPETGAMTYQLGLSPEEQAFQQRMLQQAGNYFYTPQGAQDLTEAGRATLGLGRETLDRPAFGLGLTRGAAADSFGLGSQFMEQAGMPTVDREQAIFERMRAAQRPEEERQRLATEERLAAQGRLGLRTAQFGGAPEQFALAQAQEEARNRAMLSAMQQAQAEQAQQAGLGAQFAGLGSTLAGQEQSLRAAQQARALQAMQAGQGLMSGRFGLEQQRQQLGMGALGAGYMPQAQLLGALSPGQTAAAQAQQAQLYGTGLFGEATASGIDALLGAGLGQANLMGAAGTGLLSGLYASPQTGSGGDGFLSGLMDLFGFGG